MPAAATSRRLTSRRRAPHDGRGSPRPARAAPGRAPARSAAGSPAPASSRRAWCRAATAAAASFISASKAARSRSSRPGRGSGGRPAGRGRAVTAPEVSSAALSCVQVTTGEPRRHAVVPEERQVDLAAARSTPQTSRGPAARPRERGVVAVATSFVDNAGISRVKAVPARPAAAAGRVGCRVLHGVRLLPLRRLGRRAAVGRGRRSATCGSCPTSTGSWCSPHSRAGPGRRAIATSRTASRTTRQPAAAAPAGRRAAPTGLDVQVRRSRSSGWSPPVTATRSSPPQSARRTACPGWSPSPTTRRDVLDALGGARHRGRAVPPRVRRRAARAVRRGRVAGRTPPTPRCWCARRSAPSGSATASARRSPRRSTPPASATAATCTSACGATGRT